MLSVKIVDDSNINVREGIYVFYDLNITVYLLAFKLLKYIYFF